MGVITAFKFIGKFALTAIVSASVAGMAAVVTSGFAFLPKSYNPSATIGGILILPALWMVIIPISLPFTFPAAIIGGMLLELAKLIGLPGSWPKCIALVFGASVGAFVNIALAGGRTDWPQNIPFGIAGLFAGLAGAQTFVWIWHGGFRRWIG